MFDTLKVTSAAAFLAFAGSAEAAVIDFTTATNDGTTLVATDATIVGVADGGDKAFFRKRFAEVHEAAT